MKILNHPNMSVDDLITASVYYEANKKTIKQQKLARDCYPYINQYIENRLQGKAELQPKDSYFYKNLKYHQNIKFNNNALDADLVKFFDWIRSFTNNKVKLLTVYDDDCNANLQITYK